MQRARSPTRSKTSSRVSTPRQSSYRFVVASPDLFGILIMPELLRALKREAEHVDFPVNHSASRDSELGSNATDTPRTCHRRVGSAFAEAR
jgi:hypothetical protein